MLLALESPSPMVVELVGDYDAERLGAFLADLAIDLQFEGAPQRLVIDLRGVGVLESDADTSFAVFLMEHAARIDRLAVVTPDSAAARRAAALSLQSGHPIRVHAEFLDAMRWVLNP